MRVIQRFRELSVREWAIYVSLYLLVGLLMNYVGQLLEIAKFNSWWQVLTCYIGYLLPVSILLRGLPWHAQYAYGLVAMGLLEFGGYALGSSFVYPGNIIEKIFGPYVFALGMALFFALYIPGLNAVTKWLSKKIG